MPSHGAHPRSRGENGKVATSATEVQGSSPLTRGKLVDAVARAVGEGLIPAHAGKTRDAQLTGHALEAHPRSRGENMGPNLAKAWIKGSSPLTRGKLDICSVGRCRPGLIPAHAGKTIAVGPALGRLRAHPRSRGENDPGAVEWYTRAGSSPLTRGKRRIIGVPLGVVGLIPAHAGKTLP